MLRYTIGITINQRRRIDMRKFGWSYPAGCNGPPNDDEGPCEVCGRRVDLCICPPCHVCGEIGNPGCYTDNPTKGHWMLLTEEQVQSKEDMERLKELEWDR